MVENVSEQTNSSACFVKITSTNAPACCSWLTSSTALYEAIPPQTPTTICLIRNIVTLLSSLLLTLPDEVTATITYVNALGKHSSPFSPPLLPHISHTS